MAYSRRRQIGAGRAAGGSRPAWHRKRELPAQSHPIDPEGVSSRQSPALPVASDQMEEPKMTNEQKQTRWTPQQQVERAIVLRYATGHESDRSIAAWLNAKGARTVRDRPFGKDTVREMLCNAAYAGYVSGLRDKTRAIRGLHEAIIPEELFDRVQEVRSWRTTVLKPGRPSEEYLLRQLVHCERCGARMHGCRSGNNAMRRYQCSTRRHHGNCEQMMIPAQPLEEQLVAWLHAFQPDAELRRLTLDTITAQNKDRSGDAERRRELSSQLQRLQELYVIGDLTKPRYVMRRQALEEELQRTAPPTNPDLDRAQALLENFAQFWDAESHPAERRKLILTLFAQVWAKDRQIVAVKPHPAFAHYFLTTAETQHTSQEPAPGGEATRAGATGVGAGVCTSGDRDPDGRSITGRFVSLPMRVWRTSSETRRSSTLRPFPGPDLRKDVVLEARDLGLKLRPWIKVVSLGEEHVLFAFWPPDPDTQADSASPVVNLILCHIGL